MGARAVDAGADCLIIDAESDYEGKYASADAYIRKAAQADRSRLPARPRELPLRRLPPRLPLLGLLLALEAPSTTRPSSTGSTSGTSKVATAFAHTYTFNRPYDRPLYPVGQTYDNPPRRQLKDFRQAPAPTTRTGELVVVAGDLRRGVARDHQACRRARLRRPTTSTWSSPAVIAATWSSGRSSCWPHGGYDVPISGRFNGRTERAVVALQADAVLSRPAASLARDLAGPPRAEAGAGVLVLPRQGRPRPSQADAPATAKLPPSADEIPSPPGR